LLEVSAGKKPAMAMTTVRTVIHDRRLEFPAPDDLADGTEVNLPICTDTVACDAPMTAAEIARILAAMERLRPLEIPHEVASELDTWERKRNQYGIDHADKAPRKHPDESVKCGCDRSSSEIR
jgi:hypothetical protein